MTKQKVEPVATDFKGVQAMFSCGRTTAEKIAKESGAEFRIGRKRMFSINTSRRLSMDGMLSCTDR